MLNAFIILGYSCLNSSLFKPKHVFSGIEDIISPKTVTIYDTSIGEGSSHYNCLSRFFTYLLTILGNEACKIYRDEEAIID